MRTAIYCLESPVGIGAAPLAAIAQRPGVVAMVWEAAGSRLRVRFDETCLAPETLQRWLIVAGYPVAVYTLLSRECGGPPAPAPDPLPSGYRLPWLELDIPAAGP